MFFDIFFLSYNEPNCESNFCKLRDRFPTIKRVKNVAGIANAHFACAVNSSTSMFYTVDADTDVDDMWNFFFDVPSYDRKYLHIWHSRNPINDLEYGYGGVKLWPTEVVLDKKTFNLDYSTEIGGIKIVPTAISTSIFNTSPYQTWKSAFRESVKLTNNISKFVDDTESIFRLNRWLTYSNQDAAYADWCIKGANDGHDWYQKNRTDLQLINDFNWLEQEFINRYN